MRASAAPSAPPSPRPIVFVGPSIPLDDARRILPAADFRPPVRRGDLDALPDGAVVAIVDGVFEQDLAVSPREVRNALLRGVKVLGAASMGALRAAEVEGMAGTGRIYQMYRDEALTRDDEVALLFDPETYRPLSVPLVNVRFAAESLVRAGTIDDGIGRRIVAAARRLHYRDRTYPAILQAAGLAGRADTATLASLLATHDLKRDDAQLLLESLPSFAAAPAEQRPTPGSGDRVYRGDEYLDHFSTVRVAETTSADAPLLIWEYGERIAFRDLVQFLKLTGRFRRYALGALRRLGEGPRPGNGGEPAGPTPQDLLEAVQREWGWYTVEETHVTLADLGIGLRDLETALTHQSASDAWLRSLARAEPAPFLKALRASLLLDDLALKRELLRCGSIQYFAAEDRREGGPLRPEDVEGARRALCRVSGCFNLTQLRVMAGGLGVPDPAIDAFVQDLAHARRAAPCLIGATPRTGWRGGRGRGRSRGRRAPELRLSKSPKAGHPRFCLPFAEADRITSRLRGVVGITRVGLVGQLDDLGVHVSQAYRPHSPWSTTVGSGKSETAQGARVGGIMEEIEKYAQEQFPRHGQEVRSSFHDLRRRAGALDPRRLDLPFDTRYREDLELGWRQAYDLLRREPIWVPAAAIDRRRLVNDILYSGRAGKKVFYSNGLASGFTLEEAIVHAGCEVIERDATRLAEIVLRNPGGFGAGSLAFLDLETLPAGPARLLRKLRRTGLEARILDITSDLRVPTFAATLYDDPYRDHGRFGRPALAHQGWGAHPDPAVAVTMALLEAAQTKVGNIAGAREDLSINARSLGRHERPRTSPRDADMFWFGADPPLKGFDETCGLVSPDALDEVAWMTDRARAAGVEHVIVVDYSVEEIAPVRAVRVLIPGLESVNPFCTGPRARYLALRDLLPRASERS